MDVGTHGTQGRRPCVIDPDMVVDFTQMPFPDEAFYHVVFDPPHCEKKLGKTSQLAFKYGILGSDWREMLRRGFIECFRVLKPGGTLVFKWCDVEMPLRELMRGFFDRLKSVSSGYASLSYELAGLRDADVVRLDVLVAEEAVPAFARIISRRRIQEEAESLVEKLRKLLPRQMFELKIQAKVGGRIIASRRISAMRKDVTVYLYGGDITRKMKLLEKQKKGKKKMLARGKVDIPHEVFLKVVRGSAE